MDNFEISMNDLIIETAKSFINNHNTKWRNGDYEDENYRDMCLEKYTNEKGESYIQIGTIRKCYTIVHALNIELSLAYDSTSVGIYVRYLAKDKRDNKNVLGVYISDPYSPYAPMVYINSIPMSFMNKTPMHKLIKELTK